MNNSQTKCEHVLLDHVPSRRLPKSFPLLLWKVASLEHVALQRYYAGRETECVAACRQDLQTMRDDSFHNTTMTRSDL